MDRLTKITALRDAYEQARMAGKVKSQREFASLIGIDEGNLSRALKGNEQYLTDKLVARVVAATKNYQTQGDADSIPVLPIGARAGTIQDWSDAVHDYDCERIVSPIRGADFAVQVSGDSMSPEFPSGSQIIVKRIDEEAFVAWGEVYLLDTVNGPVLKKVRRTEREDVVECVSLNPAYQSFRVACKDVRAWYRVLMCLALK